MEESSTSELDVCCQSILGIVGPFRNRGKGNTTRCFAKPHSPQLGYSVRVLRSASSSTSSSSSSGKGLIVVLIQSNRRHSNSSVRPFVAAEGSLDSSSWGAGARRKKTGSGRRIANPRRPGCRRALAAGPESSLGPSFGTVSSLGPPRRLVRGKAGRSSGYIGSCRRLVRSWGVSTLLFSQRTSNSLHVIVTGDPKKTGCRRRNAIAKKTWMQK
jgi:hypothetical protein